MTLMILLAAGLLAGCSGDEGTADTDSPKEIQLVADCWKVMDGTKATTYDNATALQTEGSFTCGVYQANTTTPYIASTAVNWSSGQWLFSDGKHYWPATGNLDFFAYMPATPPTYISSLTYSATSSPVAHTVSFSANLSSGAEKEFVFALTTGQNKAGQGASGVTLNFLHPFARVKFIKGTSPSTVTINSVSLGGVMMRGDYSYSYESNTHTWSNQSTTGNISGFDNWIIVVPNNSSKTLTVNCTWSDWSNVTKDLTTSITANWEAGTSYTYTISVTKDQAIEVSTTKYTEQW